MANFDPKTRIERLLLKYPSLHTLFTEAAPAVDEQLTVEEFCFANGLDYMDFFRRVEEAVSRQEAAAEEERKAVESHIAADNEAVAEKLQQNAVAEDQPNASAGHNPVVAGLLAVSAVVFLLSAVGNMFAGAGWVRTILGISQAVQFPHIPQILALLNLLSLLGCVLLLLWRRLGVVSLLMGTLISDLLVVALTDSIPYHTVIAALIIAALVKLPCADGSTYRIAMARVQGATLI